MKMLQRLINLNLKLFFYKLGFTRRVYKFIGPITIIPTTPSPTEEKGKRGWRKIKIPIT